MLIVLIIATTLVLTYTVNAIIEAINRNRNRRKLQKRVRAIFPTQGDPQ